METRALINKYCSKLTKEQLNILLNHSNQVFKESLKIAKRHPELNVNLVVLKNSALLHDIGTCMLTKNTSYIKHGVLGTKILMSEGFLKIAKICERHIGSGITKDEAGTLGLPKRDMLPATIEEKIVCYADKFYSKSKKEKHTISEIKEELLSYGEDNLKRFEHLHKMFS